MPQQIRLLPRNQLQLLPQMVQHHHSRGLDVQLHLLKHQVPLLAYTSSSHRKWLPVLLQSIPSRKPTLATRFIYYLLRDKWFL